jgi:hypothetical protein
MFGTISPAAIPVLDENHHRDTPPAAPQPLAKDEREVEALRGGRLRAFSLAPAERKRR